MQKVRIEKSEEISPTAKLFTLTALGADFSFLPGQYFSFFVQKPDGEIAIRPYSFCSSPSELPQFQICVRQVESGVGTNYINQHLGEEVEISKPQGDFVVPQDHVSRLIFIVSGVGVAPVRSQLLTLAAAGMKNESVLIYRASHNKEYLFREDLEILAGRFANFQLVPLVGEMYNKTVQQVIEKYCRLNDLDPPIKSGDDMGGEKETKCFIVGPPAFVRENTDRLTNLGYDKLDVMTDIWT